MSEKSSNFGLWIGKEKTESWRKKVMFFNVHLKYVIIFLINYLINS